MARSPDLYERLNVKKNRLRCQALQDFFAQLLRFAESFLVFDKNAAQFERLIGGQLAAQHHVANVDGIGQGRVFGQFFQGGCGPTIVSL